MRLTDVDEGRQEIKKRGGLQREKPREFVLAAEGPEDS